MTRLKRSLACLAGITLGLTGLAARPAFPAPGVWLSGDLHVHTIWSKDVCETPMLKNTRENPTKPCGDPTTWGWTPEQQLERAAERGMDFVALTDHNTNAHLSDPNLLAYAGPTVLIPGVEFTLNGGEGHANLLGWTSGKPADPTPGDGGYTAADMQTIADLVHAAGGLFSINHPLNPAWGLGFPNADAVEVWNFPWSSMVLPVIGSENTRAVAWWEQHYVATGRRAAAVGGSDNHWRSTGEVQGVGQPTTWVFSEDRTAAGILAGIKAGRTSVSAEPPGKGGARLFLEGDADGDGVYESMIGDTVPAGPRAFRARAAGGAGMVLRVLSSEGVVHESLIGSEDSTVSFEADLPAGSWLRAELFVPDLASERTAACRVLGVDETMDEANRTLTDIGEMLIDGASETRPLNIGPCVIVQMAALTSPIWTS